MEKGQYRVEAVANYFIERGILEGNPINPMKLQKLLYYSYGWYLAIYDGQRLFDSPIEAWEYGPVVEKIYHDVKHYGNFPITEPIKKLTFIEGGFLNSFPSIPAKDTDALFFLNGMWNVYAQYDAMTLSDATHQEGTPWDTVAKEHKYFMPKNVKIDDNLIKSHFQYLKNQVNNFKVKDNA